MVIKNSFFIFRLLMFIILFSNTTSFSIDFLVPRREIIKNSLIYTNSLIFNKITNNTNNLFIDNDDDNEDKDFNILYNNNNNKKSKFLDNNIYFTGSLNEETCFKLTQILINHRNLALTNQDYPNHINLFIQSHGGSLLPTLAVVDEIKNLEIPVYTYIRGYAASAATLLSICGSHRYMYKNSVMMIHSLKLSEKNVNSLLDVKDLNVNVDVFMNIIKKIYLENSNVNDEILNNFFNHDIWINSSLALEYGLVDEII